MSSIIIQVLQNLLENVYGDICFLLVLLYRDQEERGLSHYFCGGWDPPSINCQFLNDFVCFLCKVYSTIFHIPTYFQGADWKSRRGLYSKSAFTHPPCFSPMALLSLHCIGPGVCHMQSPHSLLTCRIVPLLPAVTRSRTFKLIVAPSPTIHCYFFGTLSRDRWHNLPLSYQNPLCRHLECNSLYSAESFTPPLSSVVQNLVAILFWF